MVWTAPVFKTAAFNHSATPPQIPLRLPSLAPANNCNQSATTLTADWQVSKLRYSLRLEIGHDMGVRVEYDFHPRMTKTFLNDLRVDALL